jgi:hypothetical protein
LIPTRSPDYPTFLTREASQDGAAFIASNGKVKPFGKNNKAGNALPELDRAMTLP